MFKGYSTLERYGIIFGFLCFSMLLFTSHRYFYSLATFENIMKERLEYNFDEVMLRYKENMTNMKMYSHYGDRNRVLSKSESSDRLTDPWHTILKQRDPSNYVLNTRKPVVT